MHAGWVMSPERPARRRPCSIRPSLIEANSQSQTSHGECIRRMVGGILPVRMWSTLRSVVPRCTIVSPGRSTAYVSTEGCAANAKDDQADAT
eukprot:2560217-Rhodomonas_salina.4